MKKQCYYGDGYSKYLRYPRTTQERRANGRKSYMEEDDYVVRFRPSRSESRLPNAWDDNYINGVGRKHHCWKHLRKTKYHPK